MPAHYAHYRFGCQLLPTLPANVRRPIQRFRRLFDMGLQGPDLFFYHNILTDDALKKLAQQGRENGVPVQILEREQVLISAKCLRRVKQELQTITKINGL